jgi:signal transduction histidine kinase
LYIASLTAIALLSVIGQAFVLRELTWQCGIMHAVAVSAQRQLLDRSVSLAVLAIQANEVPEERQKGIESLREWVRRSEREDHEFDLPDIALASDLADSFREGEQHRRRAIEAARSLLERIDQAGSGPFPSTEMQPLIRSVVTEEDALNQAIGKAVIQVEQGAISRVARLKSGGALLILYVLLVLLLEGYFVVRPAIANIQKYMQDMEKANRDMKNYAERLERSNRELQDFASVASHDLQEPLRKVQAFGDRLRLKCGESLDTQGRDYLDRIQSAAKRMQTLINDLLSYSRVTTKAQPFQPVDLAKAAREVAADLEVRVEQTRGRIELGELPTLDADPLQVRQLLQNLIGNALKYHRPEEPPVVKVWSKPLNGERESLSASLDPRREYCQILIEDNGIGFEEIYSERIFNIFQRLHGRGEYEGTGVGLAVCRKIVERHAGIIKARSTPGKGSTFLVTLPVRQLAASDTQGDTP